jgi:hypothetical protein
LSEYNPFRYRNSAVGRAPARHRKSQQKQESSSFLKKRTKKLLFIIPTCVKTDTRNGRGRKIVIASPCEAIQQLTPVLACALD